MAEVVSARELAVMRFDDSQFEINLDTVKNLLRDFVGTSKDISLPEWVKGEDEVSLRLGLKGYKVPVPAKWDFLGSFSKSLSTAENVATFYFVLATLLICYQCEIEQTCLSAAKLKVMEDLFAGRANSKYDFIVAICSSIMNKNFKGIADRDVFAATGRVVSAAYGIAYFYLQNLDNGSLSDRLLAVAETLQEPYRKITGEGMNVISYKIKALGKSIKALSQKSYFPHIAELSQEVYGIPGRGRGAFAEIHPVEFLYLRKDVHVLHAFVKAQDKSVVLKIHQETIDSFDWSDSSLKALRGLPQRNALEPLRGSSFGF